MQVELVSVQQNVNIDSGAMENFVILKLPNASTLRLPLSDQDLDVIVQLRRGGAPPPAPEPPAPIVNNPGMSSGSFPLDYGGEEANELTGGNGEGVGVFGGVESVEQLQDAIRTADRTQAAPAPPQQPQQPRRAKQVQMTEWGYPRVAAEAGAVDPGEVVGHGDNIDEDGVPSV